MNRDNNGRFIKGNEAAKGKGRPTLRQEYDYQRAVVECLTMDDWHAIICRAIADAADGDAKARQWLTDIVLQQPIPFHAMYLATGEREPTAMEALLDDMAGY